MKKKYKRGLIVLVVALILAIGIGISYAVHECQKAENNNTSLILTDEYLSVNYLDGKSFEIKNMKPNDAYSKKISVTNVSNTNTYLTISLMDVNKNSDNLELIVYDSENNVVYDKQITNIDIEVVKSIDLIAGKTASYTIMIKNIGEEDASLNANILAYKEIVKQSSNTFKETLLENNSIKDYDSSIATSKAETDEGLIKLADDSGFSYIFRGNVKNNNVNFGGFNWKIVRINGDGTIRLILDSALDNQVAYNDDSEETDNYTNKLLFDNSKIKTELENFLTTNLQENSKYIVESNFCEDVSTFKEENNVIYLNPYNRVFVDNTPTLTCMGKNISSRIGILTADEVVLAGAYHTDNNTNYYLYNPQINGSWWTMSGSQILEKNNVVDAISVNKDGSLNYEKKLSTSLYIRPVINLDSNTVVNGTGTSDDPYVIK